MPRKGSGHETSVVSVCLRLRACVVCLKMISEIVRDGGSFQLESFVCDHHVHHTSWTPSFGEVLLVKRELRNEYDHFAVAVLKIERLWYVYREH